MDTGRSFDVVRLMGGLGNQLFQYAFARRLEAEGRRVKLDALSGFAGDFYQRQFALDGLQTRIQVAQLDEIPLGLRWNRPWRGLARIVWSTLPPHRRIVYDQNAFRCDIAVITRMPAGRYYFGYWQNQHYFLPLRSELLRELTLRVPSIAFSRLVREMSNGESVSIHVRSNHGMAPSGETDLRTKAIYSVCNGSYFRDAVSYIGRNERSTYYVFSDSPSWAKANLDLPHQCKFVADLGAWSDLEELMLMAACRHHIISNSTFSWWGAWLGDHDATIVVAPKYWLSGVLAKDIGIYPEKWCSL